MQVQIIDLHCGAEAVLHLHRLTPQRQLALDLGALLGAEAVLLTTESRFPSPRHTPVTRLAPGIRTLPT